MPNGFTDRQAVELNRAATGFMEGHASLFEVPLPSIVMREVSGEVVELFEKVEAHLSMLRLKDREQWRVLSGEWDRVRKEALKRARAG